MFNEILFDVLFLEQLGLEADMNGLIGHSGCNAQLGFKRLAGSERMYYLYLAQEWEEVQVAMDNLMKGS